MREDFGATDRPDWDTIFLNLSYEIAKKSRDPSTKCGAVITTADNQIVSLGYNGFPRGVENTEHRWTTRPDKYDYVVHSERNAILNAAREGRSTKGCRMYLFYHIVPCAQCTIDLIQSGITEFVMGTFPFPGVGNGTHYNTEGASPDMLREAGVIVREVATWKAPDDVMEKFYAGRQQ